jgi:hypothetical protein
MHACPHFRHNKYCIVTRRPVLAALRKSHARGRRDSSILEVIVQEDALPNAEPALLLLRQAFPWGLKGSKEEVSQSRP